ncbi:unnamed protein product [Leptidea sinapis]|uniref:PLC-beta PH domain-containing protein n=1 Tax=Leptidea sinapis TaxID=189913 RepID=A0A5E4PXH7_9NEOP|nr:unnamed protein product [Leptidea sinapis]
MSTGAKITGISLKPIEVSKALQDGEKFIKWDEANNYCHSFSGIANTMANGFHLDSSSPSADSGAGLPVTLRVDSNGFYLYWTDQNMEVEMLDIATIRDVRTGVNAKVPKTKNFFFLVRYFYCIALLNNPMRVNAIYCLSESLEIVATVILNVRVYRVGAWKKARMIKSPQIDRGSGNDPSFYLSTAETLEKRLQKLDPSTDNNRPNLTLIITKHSLSSGLLGHFYPMRNF